MLDKERLIAAAKNERKAQEVPLKHWPDESVFMRGMTGAERNSLMAVAKDHKLSTDKKFVIDQSKYQVELITRCLCDENGVRMFKDSESDMVGTLPGEILDELMPVAQELSGLNGEDEAEKN